MCLTLTFEHTGSVFALEQNSQLSENANIKMVEDVAEEFQITEEEVQNIEKNLILEVETNENNLTKEFPFSGKFNVEISPVNMTIQSFSYSCTIYCNAKGKYSASWR